MSSGADTRNAGYLIECRGGRDGVTGWNCGVTVGMGGGGGGSR